MNVHRSLLSPSNPTVSHVSAYSRHIGRVGALAVALGIGVMVANTPGVAAADTTNPGAAPPGGTSGTDSNTESSNTGTPGAGTTSVGTTSTGTGTAVGSSAATSNLIRQPAPR
jgi:hypothetical protein